MAMQHTISVLFMFTVPCSKYIENGNVTSANRFGDTLSYTCDDGFKNEMVELSTCLASGYWSLKPRCVRSKYIIYIILNYSKFEPCYVKIKYYKY